VATGDTGRVTVPSATPRASRSRVDGPTGRTVKSRARQPSHSGPKMGLRWLPGYPLHPRTSTGRPEPSAGWHFPEGEWTTGLVRPGRRSGRKANPHTRVKVEELWLQPLGHDTRADCLRRHKVTIGSSRVADRWDAARIRGPDMPRGVPSPTTGCRSGPGPAP